MKYLGWIQLVLGLWIIVSPWILGFAYINTILWSNIFTGVFVVVVALWQIFGDDGK